MKKSLLAVFSLCALGLGVVSCTSDDDGLNPAEYMNQNIQKFGTRSSELNMYLGSVKLNSTRGCDVNGNMWPSVPAIPTNADEVLAYVATQTADKGVAWPGWTQFYIQHVGGAHNMYSYTDNNGALHNNIDGTSSQEFLQILENSGNWQHVYNFNAGMCNNAATGNAVLMTDGFNGAKTLNEYSSSTIQSWIILKYNGEYYLCFDFSAKKGDGEIPADGVYDDWVVKIIPGAGEKIPTDPTDPTDPTNPEDQPTEPEAKTGEVEFDIHHQQHTDWNEIKTSVHVRDTVAVHVFIPIPEQYQAVADDFDIRAGKDYTYMETLVIPFTIAEKTYTLPVEIVHQANGLDFFIDCTTPAAIEALKIARGVYDDGITFEIHSYVNPNVAPSQIWEWLKQVKLPSTKTAQWPVEGDICTWTHGQVSSAYYMEEMKHFDQKPE